MTLEKLENAIKRLPKKDYAALRAWFTKRDAKHGDKQMSNEARASRVNGIASDARRWKSSLASEYKRMAKDEEREREAREWADATSGDVADAAR